MKLDELLRVIDNGENIQIDKLKQSMTVKKMKKSTTVV